MVHCCNQNRYFVIFIPAPLNERQLNPNLSRYDDDRDWLRVLVSF